MNLDNGGIEFFTNGLPYSAYYVLWKCLFAVTFASRHIFRSSAESAGDRTWSLSASAIARCGLSHIGPRQAVSCSARTQRRLCVRGPWLSRCWLEGTVLSCVQSARSSGSVWAVRLRWQPSFPVHDAIKSQSWTQLFIVSRFIVSYYYWAEENDLRSSDWHLWGTSSFVPIKAAAFGHRLNPWCLPLVFPNRSPAAHSIKLQWAACKSISWEALA